MYSMFILFGTVMLHKGGFPVLVRMAGLATGLVAGIFRIQPYNLQSKLDMRLKTSLAIFIKIKENSPAPPT